MMLKTCPPTTIVAVRCGPLLLATEKVTVPFPEPFAPEVIVTKLSPGVVVQLQLPAAVTLKLPLPPALVKVWLVELSEVTQALPSKNGAILGYVMLNFPYMSHISEGGAPHADVPPDRVPINRGPPGSDGLPVQMPEPDEPGSVMPEIQSTRKHCSPGKQLPGFGFAVPKAMRL